MRKTFAHFLTNPFAPTTATPLPPLTTVIMMSAKRPAAEDNAEGGAKRPRVASGVHITPPHTITSVDAVTAASNGSTIGVHTDNDESSTTKVLELGFDVGIVQGQIVYHPATTPGSSTIVVSTGGVLPDAPDGYCQLSDAAVASVGPDLRAMPLNEGNVFLWMQRLPHCNQLPGGKFAMLDTKDHEILYDRETTTGDIIRAILKKHGFCTLKGVLKPEECRRAIDGIIEDLEASRQFEGATFKGVGATIHKFYGLACTEHAQKRRLHPEVRHIYALMYGVPDDELVQSADASAFMCEDRSKLHNVTRAAQFVCWGPKIAQDPAEVPKKVEYFLSGGSMGHNPLICRKQKSGRHFSDRMDPKHGCVPWKPLVAKLLPEQLKAFGG